MLQNKKKKKMIQTLPTEVSAMIFKPLVSKDTYNSLFINKEFNKVFKVEMWRSIKVSPSATSQFIERFIRFNQSLGILIKELELLPSDAQLLSILPLMPNLKKVQFGHYPFTL
ncbi:unnamed protein product [Rhizopus stolonifer]